MVDVHIEYNGRRMSPSQLGSAIEDGILKSVASDVKGKLSSIRCRTHGQQAKVTIKGKGLNNLSFEVNGCCQALIDQCSTKLK